MENPLIFSIMAGRNASPPGLVENWWAISPILFDAYSLTMETVSVQNLKAMGTIYVNTI
jgi:hypothetical protein